MEFTYNNKIYTLGKKHRKVGGEAPAVRIKMLNNETKVIGMMAPKTQVMIGLLKVEHYTQALDAILKEYPHKITAYVISSDEIEAVEKKVALFDLPKENVSVDFKEFASKFGVNMEDEHIAQSIFIINKEGEISYIQILKNSEEIFDLEEFKTQLFALINQKQKGHTHENWMGV